MIFLPKLLEDECHEMKKPRKLTDDEISLLSFLKEVNRMDEIYDDESRDGQFLEDEKVHEDLIHDLNLDDDDEKHESKEENILCC